MRVEAYSTGALYTCKVLNIQHSLVDSAFCETQGSLLAKSQFSFVDVEMIDGTNKMYVCNRPRERDETERVIRFTLKEIMMSVDLDEVTSKVIRGRLEDELDMDLAEYKSFIDHEMLTILGQMDAPTEIFDHVYLGSEWNASNLEELQRNGYV